MFKSLGIFAVVVLLIIAIVLGPWVVIWAWNTLFGAAYLIPYTIWTWLAVLVLGVFIRSNVKINKS
jgi:hypothetical protein